jgi:DNA mismatch repair protein MSH6
MVECAEAASVLRYATPNSLVILDELGRGTSTFDGYAIAFAVSNLISFFCSSFNTRIDLSACVIEMQVFRHLVDAVNCRLLFATHYHPLTKEFAAHPFVCLYHMAFAFECGVDVRDASESPKRLVFLYKLSPGASPDSYGLHVASLAGLPEKVIKQAGNARGIIQSRLSSTFRANVHRVHFSHLHEDWLRTILVALSPNVLKSNTAGDMEDAYDTLLCVWHELQTAAKAPL